MSEKRLPTGIPGLDEVLQGGFIPGRAYLARGGPGTGKTTLGLHFLTAGAANGEKALFITLGEPEAMIRQNAERMGFDLSNVAFLDLSPTPEFFAQVETYDIFSPAEVEREPTTRKIVEQVEKLQPSRVFIDAMTQFRYLAADPFQYRKQVLSFLRFLVERGTTVLFTSEGSAEAPDADLQFLSDGVIDLEYAPEGRILAVTKFRGSDFLSGRHSMRLGERGMEVFPRLVPEVYRREFALEVISSGVPELDELLHGGLERGTITIITGPSGVGKTTLGLQFMKEAAGRGERSVVYTFEEGVETLVGRCEAINIPVHAMMERGTLEVVKVEPLRYTPDEFARLVRREVEEEGSHIVMIDSIAGYRLSLRGEDLVSHLHALCKYLSNMGVTTLLINEVEYITGEFRATEVGISYLADNIIFLRFLEMRGELHKAIGVLKKRLSDFEKTLREFQITRYGVKVGAPLTGLRGILSGTPELIE
ncbi:MAG: ATPase domain-containing protein [Anaerolineae bacterium]|nr:ATPase domain-containing protein [Anaerolineae bacterium]